MSLELKKGAWSRRKEDTDTVSWCPSVTSQEVVLFINQTRYKSLYKSSIVLFFSSWLGALVQAFSHTVCLGAGAPKDNSV